MTSSTNKAIRFFSKILYASVLFVPYANSSDTVPSVTDVSTTKGDWFVCKSTGTTELVCENNLRYSKADAAILVKLKEESRNVTEHEIVQVFKDVDNEPNKELKKIKITNMFKVYSSPEARAIIRKAITTRMSAKDDDIDYGLSPTVR